MNIAQRLLHLTGVAEVRVFLFMAVFGWVIGAGYWFLTYEVAGTILLVGFGIATGVIGLRLATVGERRLIGGSERDARPPEQPFGDEGARLPDETIAPFAVGIGAAIAATSLVFGLAPLVVGILPFGWGTWSWLRSAGEELTATVGTDEEPPA